MEQKCSIWNVFNVFCEEPLRIHHIRQISRKIELSATSVKKHLEELEKEGLLIRKEGDIYKGYAANRENEDFIFYKKINNMIRLKKSGVLKDIVENCYPDAIVLYGSYSKGEDVEDSDVDLFVISKTKAKINEEEYAKKLRRNLHVITEKDFKRLSSEMKTNIFNGIVVYGYLENE